MPNGDGTTLIKKTMGSEDDAGSGVSPLLNGPPEFTQDETNDMDKLILSLSKESDDDERRKRLAKNLDKELASASNNASAVGHSEGIVVGSEVPRFAKLFQLSLNNTGEKVQTSTREVALRQQNLN